MASAETIQALPTVIQGVFQSYISGPQLAPFFAIAPTSANRTSSGVYQISKTDARYNAQLKNVGPVAPGATRGMDIETFSEVTFVHDRFGTNWQYFDDRTLEVFAASDAQIDLGNRAIRTVQTRMSGYLSTRLALATQGLTQSTVGQLDLTDKTTDLVGYLRSVISDQNLRVGDEFRPNVFAFGPDVHEMLIKLDQVREAGVNLGTAYPQVGVVEGAGAGVAPAVQRVCQAIGLTAVLVGSSYIDTTGNPAWTFSKDSTCVVTSHGLEDYSALKTYTPYDELINVIVSEVTAPNDPGWAWRADAEMALAIQDPNLGRKLNVKIA